LWLRSIRYDEGAREVKALRGQWKSRKPITYEQAKAVQEAVGCSAPMSRLLAVRGLETREQYDAFAAPRVQDVPNPAELHDAQRACQRIREAKARGEKVLVYGDYDVDGVCAVTLAVRGLREFGIDPAWYVPDRKKDGYGLHQEAARHAAVDGVRLIVTVDNGVAAHAAIDRKIVAEQAPDLSPGDKPPEQLDQISLNGTLNL